MHVHVQCACPADNAHYLFCVPSDKENADPNGAGKGKKTTSRGKRKAPLLEDSGTNQQTKTADKLKKGQVILAVTPHGGITPSPKPTQISAQAPVLAPTKPVSPSSPTSRVSPVPHATPPPLFSLGFSILLCQLYSSTSSTSFVRSELLCCRWILVT